jgi:hypothetical protein
MFFHVRVPYSFEANHDIERAFQAGEEQVPVQVRQAQHRKESPHSAYAQVCEAGQVVTKSRKGKPRKRICRVDLLTSEQTNARGKGSTFAIHRRPRSWISS